MAQYLLLKHIEVQNANAIAGLTYGFPAITHFLGFAHALSRQLPDALGLRLGGVTVVSHKNNVHVRQPTGWGDYVFALTRNPVTAKGETAPINEEGRMNMQVSLLIEVEGLIAGDKAAAAQLIAEVKDLAPQRRLAGGQILTIGEVDLLADVSMQKKALRRLMPGFVLCDRHDYLAQHHQHLLQHNAQASLFDAWCEFAMLTYHAVADDEHVPNDDNQPIPAQWQRKRKLESGYLVPIMTGYRAISPCYAAGEVANVRDPEVPVSFVEAAYSVGEWRSVHRLKGIDDECWRYHGEHPWYLARATTTTHDEPIEPDVVPTTDDNTDFDPDFL